MSLLIRKDITFKIKTLTYLFLKCDEPLKIFFLFQFFSSSREQTLKFASGDITDLLLLKYINKMNRFSFFRAVQNIDNILQ